MLDKCKQLFSSAKILLKDQQLQLKMDIVKANELLQHLYGPPPQGAFDNNNIKVVESIEECNKIVPLNKYKLAQEAIL